MNICVVGTGYVGLVTAAGFAAQLPVGMRGLASATLAISQETKAGE